MRRITHRVLAGLVAASFLVLGSCSTGPSEEALEETGATLEGTVKFQGKAVPFAVIFVKGPNAMAQANVAEDGTYKVLNVPLGEVSIGVNTDAARGNYQAKAMASGANQGPEGKGKGKTKGLPAFVDVPKNFADPDSSGIKTTINEGANTFNITLP